MAMAGHLAAEVRDTCYVSWFSHLLAERVNTRGVKSPDFKVLIADRFFSMRGLCFLVIHEPRRFGGGTFANILPDGYVCELLAKIVKIQPKNSQKSLLYKLMIPIKNT